MDEILKNIIEYSYPVVVSIYLLVRMESKMEKLTESLFLLNESIKDLKIIK